MEKHYAIWILLDLPLVYSEQKNSENKYKNTSNDIRNSNRMDSYLNSGLLLANIAPVGVEVVEPAGLVTVLMKYGITAVTTAATVSCAVPTLERIDLKIVVI